MIFPQKIAFFAENGPLYLNDQPSFQIESQIPWLA